jgi:hypothetical protein
VFADVTNEVTGTGYPAGGVTLTGKLLTTSGNVVTWSAADVAILLNAGGFTTGRIFVLYKSTGTPSTSPLICYHDTGQAVGNASDDLVIELAQGILQL